MFKIGLVNLRRIEGEIWRASSDESGRTQRTIREAQAIAPRFVRRFRAVSSQRRIDAAIHRRRLRIAGREAKRSRPYDSDAHAAQLILGLRRFRDRRRNQSSALRAASLCAQDPSAQSVRSLSDEWRRPSDVGAMGEDSGGFLARSLHACVETPWYARARALQARRGKIKHLQGRHADRAEISSAWPIMRALRVLARREYWRARKLYAGMAHRVSGI